MAAQARYCGRCGAPVAFGAPFCGRCGAPQQAIAAAAPVYSYPVAPRVPYRTAQQWRGSQVAIAGGLLAILGFAAHDLIFDIAVMVIAAAGLLLYLRRVIHDALLVEGAEHEIGPDAPCPECHRIVPAMAFCPACGAARAAGTKQGRTRAGGAV